MSTKSKGVQTTVTALKVHQWLSSWDQVNFDPKASQAKPDRKHFFLCSIKASHLKALTGVYRRSTQTRQARALDPNVQRGHEEGRSAEISEFVRYGFPWCEMTDAKRNVPGAEDLKKPGWLPTAILVNILPPKAKRNGVEIPESDLIHINESASTATLHLPKGFSGDDWAPEKVFPLEVIDGQHRLWAFENFQDDFELPVVAFYGLDPGWQAYLFWSVNITPKKINRSLAFDLYPLLRQQSWLDKFAGHSIYRETRCQELVEALWSHPSSPWCQRINMLGETKDQRDYKGPAVTQAAWIRSLFGTLVKHWDDAEGKIGGLFGAPRSNDETVLPWTRPMQAAVLIYFGASLKKTVRKSKAKWAQHLRDTKEPELIEGDDPAFYGEFSLLSTDQGIRGILFVLNDLLVASRTKLDLGSWRWEKISDKVTSRSAGATEHAYVTLALKSFEETSAAKFIDKISISLANYDWRTSSTPQLSNDERLRQAVFRGSSGYKEMRVQLLRHLAASDAEIGKVANDVIRALSY